jgi:hypothetical protein
MCFASFEESCALLKLASNLGLEAANDAARDYIKYYMYPDKLWHAYHCAKDASDDELLELINTVLFYTQFGSLFGAFIVHANTFKR